MKVYHCVAFNFHGEIIVTPIEAETFLEALSAAHTKDIVPILQFEDIDKAVAVREYIKTAFNQWNHTLKDVALPIRRLTEEEVTAMENAKK